MHILSTFKSSQTIIYQSLALLYNLLIEDPRTKVNLANVRHMALAAGIVDEIQDIQKLHGKQNKGLADLCKEILPRLISDWS